MLAACSLHKMYFSSSYGEKSRTRERLLETKLSYIERTCSWSIQKAKIPIVVSHWRKGNDKYAWRGLEWMAYFLVLFKKIPCEQRPVCWEKSNLIIQGFNILPSTNGSCSLVAALGSAVRGASSALGAIAVADLPT